MDFLKDLCKIIILFVTAFFLCVIGSSDNTLVSDKIDVLLFTVVGFVFITTLLFSLKKYM